MKWSRILMVNAAVVFMSALSSQAYDFVYAVNNGTVTLTAYQGPGGAVAVPSSINGLPVTALAGWLFSQTGTTVTNLSLPSSVQAVGDGAFYGCPNLTSVTVDPLNPTFTSVDGVLFSKDQTFIEAFPPGRTGTYSVPGGVTGMGDYAFYFCPGLTNVTLPNSLTNIGTWSFGDCTNLMSVSIGNGVRSIGSLAFLGCSRLSSIVIPDSVTEIKDGIPDKGQGGAFSFCIGLTNVTFGTGLTNVGDYTFFLCTGLSNIVIPDNVARVGYNAFLNCSSLTTVRIGAQATMESYFLGCPALASIDVNPLNALYSSAGGVWFNKDQSSLLQYPPARRGNYTIPDSVTNLALGAFYGATGLTGINLGTNLTSVDDGGFQGCSSLTNVTLNQKVTSIGASAFAGCTSLKYVTIPSSVTSLGDSAFAQCTSLLGVFFEGNAPALGQGVFGGDNASAYYPQGTDGFGFSFGGLKPALWNPRMRTTDASFGVTSNAFGFNIVGAANLPLVIEASTNLSAGSWIPLQTTTPTNSLLYFSDPQLTNYPHRFYRIRSP